MRQLKASIFGACAVVACSVWMVVGAQASADGKVLICHGTVSEPHPYSLIYVDAAALAGHFDETAPGHGPFNAPDFFPAAGATDCSAGPGGGGDGGGD